MRQPKFKILIILIIVVSLTSCEVDNDDGVNSPLPEITSIGAILLVVKLMNKYFCQEKVVSVWIVPILQN